MNTENKKNVRSCTACGGRVAKKAKKCPHCGQDHKNIKSCTACGGMVSKKAKTCPHCGQNRPAMARSDPLWSFLMIIGFIAFVTWAGTQEGIRSKPVKTAYKTHEARKQVLSPSVPSAPPTPINPASKIARHAVLPMKKFFYPKTYARWGNKGVAEINSLLRPAALHVAKFRSCDRVDLVELSDIRSKAPDKIVFFVDCANGQRFYVSKKDLTNAVPAVSK